MTRERPVEEAGLRVMSPVLIPVEVPVKLGAEIGVVQSVETVQFGSVGRQSGSRVVPGAKVAETRAGIKEKEVRQTTKAKTKEKTRNLVSVCIFLKLIKTFIW